MRCLITGITGFTGQHLANYLSQQGQADIWGLASPKSSFSVPNLPTCKILRSEINQGDAVCAFIRKIRPDVIFHLAGKTRGSDLPSLLESNVNATRVVLEIAREFDCRVLVPGSAAEYGFPQRLPIPEGHPIQPVTPYGKSKAAQIALAQTYAEQGLRVYLARPFNLIGPGLPQTFLCAALVARVVSMSPEEELLVPQAALHRDFVDVRDVVDAYWQIVTRSVPGEIYNVCTGRAYSMAEIAQELLRLANRPLNFRPQPGASSEPSVIVGSNRKIRTTLGWSPRIPFLNSLTDMLAYEKNRTLPPVQPTT